MQTRQLGYTDLQLTTVGFGAWAIGGPWQFGWGPQDDGEAVGAILTALDEGINWIDTAPVYGCGHSEELVGKALKQTKEKPLIATKCSLLWNDKRQKVSCLKAKSIREECHAIEQAWEEIVKLAEEGKVRYMGVSNFSVEQMERIRRIAPVASLQPPYSMVHREIESELLAYCAENDIGVIVYSPMQRGLLTGTFSQERLAGLPLDDHRRRSPDFHEPRFTATLELVDQLRPIAERNGRTLAQLSISWVLRRPEVTAAIVGARRPDQITETTPASDFELSSEDVEEIEQLLAERLKKIANA
jgi:aryl-alcohol dehydrogenase-like predicted oxidoreductase